MCWRNSGSSANVSSQILQVPGEKSSSTKHQPALAWGRQKEEDTHACVCERETQTCWLLRWLVNSLDVALQLEGRRVETETVGTHGTLTRQGHVGHVLLHVTHQPEGRGREMWREDKINQKQRRPRGGGASAVGPVSPDVAGQRLATVDAAVGSGWLGRG